METEQQGLFQKMKRMLTNERESGERAEAEIMNLVTAGHQQGVLDESEAKMIQNVFSYMEKDAKDIMTHRKHIIALDAKNTLAEAVSFMIQQNNSRFPVFEEDIDNIIGVLHLRDAMKCYMDPSLQSCPLSTLKDALMQPVFIPETRSINRLFKQMKEKQLHMVLVIDEYGQTSGLVTMEDIIEEIMGNILDEYDEAEVMITRANDHTFYAKGMTALEELEECLHISFEDDEDEDLEYETLNGFLIVRLERIPTEEDIRDKTSCTVFYKGWRFSILEVDNNMIQRVRIEQV